MRFISRLIGLSVVAMALSGFSAASALAANLVDGSISAEGDTCSWTNASTSADPPNTLTINRATVNSSLSCTGGVSATLNNDPTVTFNDANGTATANLIDATVVSFGVSCRYQASNMVFQRDGTTRNYSGTATVPLSSGGFFCPNPVELTASASFH